MTLSPRLHPVRIKPPFYQGSRAGESHCGLHRYLDTEFVNRFKRDILKSEFHLPQFEAWRTDERHVGQEPVLRLPLHRAFHLVCCEVVCDRLGHPALDPRKITSAGFVIRKVGDGGEKSWELEEGEALGWRDAPTQLRDPDIHRRLCASGVLRKRSGEPAYSGEEVHPLHILKTTDAAGKIHTLLYGYLPLGGFYYERNPQESIDEKSWETTQSHAAASLPWPFGSRDSQKQKWLKEHGVPVDRGRPSKAMFELLRLLVTRYHVGEAGIDANEQLERIGTELWFHNLPALPASLRDAGYTANNKALFAAYRTTSTLADYLKSCFEKRDGNPLVKWIAEQEKRISEANGIENIGQFDPLPASDGEGTLSHSLLMLEDDAQEIRVALGQRLRHQTLAQVREIPLPKFTQGANDLYQVVPFVRSQTDDGKEQIQWADANARTIRFRVAAPFDPEASRPSLIQIPSLSDLRRGLAKGAAMITPSDTFNLLSRLKPEKGIGPDTVPKGEPGRDLGIQWICSFSLPVVTLIAMILLMIMISLLNIVFFWLPWVRICLPFPKMK
ncbi:MAG: hypothetical protein WC012_03670 [Thiohalomonadaceae bacterium]